MASWHKKIEVGWIVQMWQVTTSLGYPDTVGTLTWLMLLALPGHIGAAMEDALRTLGPLPAEPELCPRLIWLWRCSCWWSFPAGNVLLPSFKAVALRMLSSYLSIERPANNWKENQEEKLSFFCFKTFKKIVESANLVLISIRKSRNLIVHFRRRIMNLVDWRVSLIDRILITRNLEHQTQSSYVQKCFSVALRWTSPWENRSHNSFRN